MSLLEAHLSPYQGLAVTAAILVRLGDERRDGCRSPSLVKGDVGEICRSSVSDLSCEKVFRFHTDPHFHRGLPHHIEVRFECEKVSHKYRMVKDEAVYGSGHGVSAGMPKSHHSCSSIDVLHDHSAVNVSAGIGIFGVHLDCHGDSAVTGALALHDLPCL